MVTLQRTGRLNAGVRCHSSAEGCLQPACRLIFEGKITRGYRKPGGPRLQRQSLSAGCQGPTEPRRNGFQAVRARARALSAVGGPCEHRYSERAVAPAAATWLAAPGTAVSACCMVTLQAARAGSLPTWGAAAMWRVVWGPHAGCQGPTAPLPHGFQVCALARALCQRLGGPCETRYSERAVAPAARRPAWLHQRPL